MNKSPVLILNIKQFVRVPFCLIDHEDMMLFNPIVWHAHSKGMDTLYTENVIEANKAKSGAVLLNGAAMFEEN